VGGWVGGVEGAMDDGRIGHSCGIQSGLTISTIFRTSIPICMETETSKTLFENTLQRAAVNERDNMKVVCTHHGTLQ